MYCHMNVWIFWCLQYISCTLYMLILYDCLLSDGQTGIGGICPEGHYCPQGTTVPLPCGVGSFINITGQDTCLPCPAGYYCLETTVMFTETPCPPGRYCPEGTQFADQFRCPARTYFNETGAKDLSDCLPCPPGTYCETDGLSMYTGLCAPGIFLIFIYFC